MYKIIANFMMCALNIAFSVAFAQEFSFKPQTNTYATTPPKENTLSPQGFANSSTQAYQEQQAKIAAIASEKVKAAHIKNAKAAQATSKPTPDVTQKPAIPLEPQKPIRQENSDITTNRPVSETPPVQPAPVVQPYTGFQSPPSTGGNSGSAPSNTNQNSGGWGSSIKY
jgi:hypothetical protein